MNRRKYVTILGTSVIPLSGCSFARDDSLDRPIDAEQWKLAFEDTFHTRTLDASNWGIGWGWGRNTSMSPTRMTPDNVNVRDGKLRIKGTHERGLILSGGIHSRNAITLEPGSYIEARIKFAEREGFQNAFWMKPNSGAWPPEIDVVELWQDGTSRDDVRTSRHNIHYTRSTKPGDRSTYEKIGATYDHDSDPTDDFHVYSVRWHDDRISHFVDGKQVSEFRVKPMLKTMQNGVPFYMMISLNINNIGKADVSEPWGEEMVVDWIRVWTQ